MKRFFVYLALLAIAGVLGVINHYLMYLQVSKQEQIANLQEQVQRHLAENKFLNDRNDALRVEVENLRSPDSYLSYEAKAREDYGLIGVNETFFVLSKEEIKIIPDVKGLVEEQKSLANSSLTENKGNKNTPPTPVPLRLESLQ